MLPFYAGSGTVPRAACAGSPFPCHRKGALTCGRRPVSFLAQRSCNDRCTASAILYLLWESFQGLQRWAGHVPGLTCACTHMNHQDLHAAKQVRGTGAPHCCCGASSASVRLPRGYIRGCMQCLGPLLPCLKALTPAQAHKHRERPALGVAERGAAHAYGSARQGSALSPFICLHEPAWLAPTSERAFSSMK